MDSDRRSAQVERLEVVDTDRRRRWSEDEKLKIVLELTGAAPGRGDGAAIWSCP
jgi:transposase-like protein